MDDLKGGEMRSPIRSDDVTHIYRNLQKQATWSSLSEGARIRRALADN